jgi:phenylacetate-coenzyme A ligase PaaK-like adenylate-forming protein
VSRQSVRFYVWDKIETIPPREMESLQVERLRAGVDRLAKIVPFYKNKLAEAGVTAKSNSSGRGKLPGARQSSACG